MHRSGVFLLAAFLLSCSGPAPEQPAVVERARSVHSLSITDIDGARQTLLIAGIQGPDRDQAPDAAIQARAALDALIEDAAITHSPVGEPDRYGRIPSAIMLGDGSNLAVTLIEQGWALAWPREGQEIDLGSLYDAEASARDADAGAWALGAFSIRDTDPNRLAPHLDSAQIIEGRVISAATARDGRVFLNFGLDWRTDFTAVADEDAVARFNEAGLDLMALEGAVVRVRGWLYELNGPSISLRHPAQIELVDAPQAPTLPR